LQEKTEKVYLADESRMIPYNRIVRTGDFVVTGIHFGTAVHSG
jgi:hypothetical protein